jgi:hypothetical protein
LSIIVIPLHWFASLASFILHCMHSSHVIQAEVCAARQEPRVRGADIHVRSQERQGRRHPVKWPTLPPAHEVRFQASSIVTRAQQAYRLLPDCFWPHNS